MPPPSWHIFETPSSASRDNCKEVQKLRGKEKGALKRQLEETNFLTDTLESKQPENTGIDHFNNE